MIELGKYKADDLTKGQRQELGRQLSRRKRVYAPSVMAEKYLNEMNKIDPGTGCAGAALISLGAEHILPSMEKEGYYGNFEGYDGPIRDVGPFAMELAAIAVQFGVGIYFPSNSSQFVESMLDLSTIGATIFVSKAEKGHVFSVLPYPAISFSEESDKDEIIFDPENFLVLDRGDWENRHPDGTVREEIGDSAYIVGVDGLIDLYVLGKTSGSVAVLSNYDDGSGEEEVF